jgi:hypothetical protein
VYAVKRYAYRLGHAARSARFATSIEQLVVGLAPVMGWGAVPRERSARARFVRAHRRSVQRWLDDLQAAGLVLHEPERDEDGLWWRTQLVLLSAAELGEHELAAATARSRGWAARERGRARRSRRAPSLGAVRGRSSVPSARTRGSLARSRRIDDHERRRRVGVEAQIASALLAHPFGAPPPSAPSPVSAKPSQSSEPARSVQTASSSETVLVKTGARARDDRHRAPADSGSIEETERDSLEDLYAVAARRVGERLASPTRVLLQAQVSARVAEVVLWPAERVCPLGRLREAWVAHRHGPAIVVDRGASEAGAVAAAPVGRAVRLYEAHRATRPDGWPESGAAALCVLASQHRADTLAGDVARLLLLAKGMRAVQLERDVPRLRRAQRRAARRRHPAPKRLVFRLAAQPARWETGEQRRRRVRDALLLAGRNPAAWPNAQLASEWLELDGPRLVEPDPCEELDGFGARATRFRDQLARGDWSLPDFPLEPRPQTGGPR